MTAWERPQAGRPPGQAASSTPTQTLVLYLGNPIVENDQLGLIAGRRAASRLAGRPGVAAREFTGSPLDLLADCGSVQRLLLIDTVCTGGEPGTIHVYDEGELLAHGGDFYPHGLNVPQAIALARRLQVPVPEQISLIGIEVPPVKRFGEGPSPELACRVEEICAHVGRVVEELLASR